jgi:hypothetical protein
MVAVFELLAALWGNPWGKVLLIGGCLFALGFWKGFSIEHTRMNSLKALHKIELAQAISNRDEEWQIKIDKANQDHEKELDAAIAAAASVVVVTSDDQLGKLCRSPKTGSDCREKDGNGMPGAKAGEVVN